MTAKPAQNQPIAPKAMADFFITLDKTQAPTDLIKIGQLRAPYGIKGGLWIYSYTDPMNNLFKYKPWYVEHKGQWYVLNPSSGKPQGQGLVVTIKEIQTRNDAELLFGQDIYISEQSIPKPASDEYYWKDLVGLKVFTHESMGETVCLGEIDHLFETGANDVMVIKATADSLDQEQRLIPWHKSTIAEVNLTEKTVTVFWGSDF